MASNTRLPSDVPPFTSPPAGFLASDFLELLEQAWIVWRKDKTLLPPNLMEFLPAEPGLRDRVLPPLAEVQFEYGLCEGLWDQVEAFLEKYPELGSHVEVLSTLIRAEMEHRRENGETVSDDEYWRRFPPFAALQLRDDFEKALREGKLPAIEDFLHNPLVPRPLVLQHLVALDLDERLRRREHVRLEEYLARFPDLPRESEAIADLLLLEYEGRTRVERDIPFAEYEKRFPNAYPNLAQNLRIPTIEGFTILSQLGRGGMGLVYKAREERLGSRLVAVKVILTSALQQSEALRRFQREADATAQIEHPNIARVYQVGQYETEQGGCLPYLVMEYVSGGTLAAAMGGRPQKQRDAAETAECLALAVHAAHQRGIIHRDLKPQNVLLAPEPKITDFGLAKLMELDSSMTQGQIVGTPGYMAPEQVKVQQHPISPATDVWALGAILYEALTGRPPFQAPHGKLAVFQPPESGGIAGASVQRNEEPNTEGTTSIFYRILHDEPVRPRRLEKGTDRHLEAICLKCLEKKPRDRFASAEALAQELRRFLNHERPTIGLVTPWSESRRWCRRNPVIATAAAIVFLVVTASAIWSHYARLVAVAARLEANNLQRKAEVNEGIAKNNEQKALRAEAKAFEEKQIAESERERAEHGVYAARIRMAADALVHDDRASARDSLDLCRWDLCGWEYYYLRDKLEEGYRLYVPTAQTEQQQGPPFGYVSRVGVSRLGITSDNTRLVCVDTFGNVITLDTRTGRKLSHIGQNIKNQRDCLALNRSCTLVAFKSDKHTVLLHDATTGTVVTSLDHGHEVSIACFSDDGKYLATGGSTGIRIWGLSDNHAIADLHGHTDTINDMCFSPDGRLLLSGSADTTAKVWNPKSGKVLCDFRGHTDDVCAVAFSPDSTSVVTTSQSSPRLAVWHPTTGALRAKQDDGIEVGVYDHDVTFSPDGKQVAVWDSLTLTLVDLSGYTTSVSCKWLPKTGSVGISSPHLSYTSDGQQIGFTQTDGSVCLWNVNQLRRNARQLRQTRATSVIEVKNVSPGLACLSPTAPLVAVALADGAISVIDLSSGAIVTTLQPQEKAVRGMVFSPEGRWLIVTHENKEDAVAWCTATWRLEQIAGLTSFRNARSLQATADGKWYVVTTDENETRIIDASTRQVERTLPDKCVAVMPDLSGVVVPSGGIDSVTGKCRYRLRDTATGTDVMPLEAIWCERPPHITPDGRFVCAETSPGTVLARAVGRQGGDLMFRHMLREGEGHRDRHEGVVSFAFDRTGHRLLTASGASIKVWDVSSQQELLTLSSGPLPLLSRTQFSPDGNRVICLMWLNAPDQRDAKGRSLLIHVWGASMRRESRVLDMGRGPVCHVAFSPDGMEIASVCEDGGIALYEAQTGTPAWHRQFDARRLPAVYCPSDKALVTAIGRDLLALDRATGTPKSIARLPGEATDFAFVPSGLVVANGHAIYDLPSTRIKMKAPIDDSVLDGIAVSQDGKKIAFGTHPRRDMADTKSHQLLIWIPSEQRVIRMREGHGARINHISFSPDGRRIVTSSHDATVRLWDVDERGLVWTFHGQSDSSVVDHEGTLVADALENASFSPNGKHVAVGTGERAVVILDSTTGQEVARLYGHTGAVTCVAFDSSGHRLVSGSVDGTIRVWTLDYGQ